MGVTCDYCGTRFLGRSDARFCGTRCRVYWHRSLPRLPRAMTARVGWTRAVGKRPVVATTGWPASSTDRGTWSSWVEVHRSKVGDGFGVMLGDGLGCWDLDHCLDGDVISADALAVLAGVADPLWVERSVSGTGLHVFVAAAEGPGRKLPGVEFYSRARFIRVTGDGFTIPGM